MVKAEDRIDSKRASFTEKEKILLGINTNSASDLEGLEK